MDSFPNGALGVEVLGTEHAGVVEPQISLCSKKMIIKVNI